VSIAASLLAAPTGLIAQLVNQADVFLVWNTPSTPGTVSYLIEAGSSPGLSNLASLSTGNTSNRFQANDVPPGTYYVRVRAIDASGAAGPASNEVTITIGACLGATGLFIATNSGGTVRLQWQPGNGVTSYVLDAGTAAGLSNIASVPVGNTTSFTATGVPNGTYFVRVRTNSTCGALPASNEVRLVVGTPITR
jgi:hypothetical protein